MENISLCGHLLYHIYHLFCSYSYDLTNTLQYNMQDPVFIQYPIPFPETHTEGKKSNESKKVEYNLILNI